MKNKKKNIIIISCVVLITIFVLSLLLINNEGNKHAEDKLLLECSSTVTLNDSLKNNQEIKLYKNEENLKLFQISSFNLSNDLSEEQSELLFTMTEQNLKNRINNEFGNSSNYIDFKSKRENKELYFEIIYIINQTNYDEMKRIFDLDLYNSEKEVIIHYFEKEGFSCIKY